MNGDDILCPFDMPMFKLSVSFKNTSEKNPYEIK